MHCDQLQRRIDELLDRREDLRSDGQLLAHLALCPSCTRRAAAYEAMLLGVDLLGELKIAKSSLPQPIVRRRPSAEVELMLETGRRRYLIAAAVAATLLIVAFYGRSWTTGGTPGTPALSERSVASNPDFTQFGDGLTVQALGRVCHSTGQGLAALPQTVRRVASLPETGLIVGHIRPFTEPVGATWEVLLRAWPGTSNPTAVIPELDTSLISWHVGQYS